MTETIYEQSPDFKKLFESASSLFIVLSANFDIVAVSDAYALAAKMSREDLVGKNFFSMFPHLDEDAKKALQRILRLKKADFLTIKPQDMKADAGTETHYWGTINTPVMSPDGNVEYIIRRAEDMTDYVRQQNESRNVAEERDLFFSHSFDLLAIVGPDGYFKRVNPAFEKVLGYTPYEMYSKPIIDFLHPDDVEKTKLGISKLAEGETRLGSINRYLGKDGVYRTFAWNTTTLGSKFFSIGRDISELVEAKNKIIELNEELKKKNEDLERKIEQRALELNESKSQVLQLQKLNAIGRLAGGIAHDFNNVLNIVTLYSELMEMDPSNSERTKENVRNIKAATTSATALTRQLLIFSSKQVTNEQILNANDLISNLEKMLNRLIGENIKIELKLSQQLKNIKMDASQLEQVVMNLVVNARDAMLDGGTVTVETKNIYLDADTKNHLLPVKGGDYICLSVSDTGEGMDAATQSKIFEPFFTTKGSGKGTGLGLSTIFGIVKQCEGTLWIYSEPKKGSIFKIYFPVCDQDVNKVEIQSGLLRGADMAAAETILLVEDSESLNKGFVSVLEASGYTVLSASNGMDAISLAESYGPAPIHLILTDMVMPGINGLELAEKIRLKRKDIRVLYMSGYANDSLKNLGEVVLQETEFLQKPFGVNELLNKIKLVLKS